MSLRQEPTPAPTGRELSDRVTAAVHAGGLDVLSLSPQFLRMMEELLDKNTLTYWVLAHNPHTGEQEPREMVGTHAAALLEHRSQITPEEKTIYKQAFEHACQDTGTQIDDIEAGIQGRQDESVSPPSYLPIRQTSTAERLGKLVEDAERTGVFWVETVDVQPGQGDQRFISYPDGLPLIETIVFERLSLSEADLKILFQRVLKAMRDRATSTGELQSDLAHKMDYWAMQGLLTAEMVQAVLNTVFQISEDLTKRFTLKELETYLLIAANGDANAPYLDALIPAIFPDQRERHAFQVRIGATPDPVAPHPVGLPAPFAESPIETIPPRVRTGMEEQRRTAPYAVPRALAVPAEEAAEADDTERTDRVIRLTRGRLMAGVAALAIVIGGTVMLTKQALKGESPVIAVATAPQVPGGTTPTPTPGPRPTPQVAPPNPAKPVPAPQPEVAEPAAEPRAPEAPKDKAEAEAQALELQIATRKYFGKTIIDHKKSFDTIWKAEGWEKAVLTQDGGLFGIKLIGPNGKTATIGNREVEAGQKSIKSTMGQE